MYVIMFAEKLNFLISIIGISGGELAHAISLDPSYISRLRRGKRALPKDQHFTESISSYFATQITSEYQNKLMCDALGITEWPEAPEKAQKYILNWLLTENPRQRNIIRTIFKQITDSSPLDVSTQVENLPDWPECKNDEREIYFGKKGREEAFLHFLAIATDTSESDEMQMFCNEDLSWQIGTPGYRNKVESLFTAYAKAGNTIKIIHSLSEDTDAMLDMLQTWIPIYLTGYVEPFYYPKIREDFYRRTAFVVPGVAAMLSSSLNGNTAEAMTFILKDKEAIKVVESELSYLMSQSNPLAKVFSSRDEESLHNVIRNFFKAKADTILLHGDITPLILPDNIRKSKDAKNFSCFKNVENLLKKYDFTDIMSMPDVAKICDGKTPVPLFEVIGSNQAFLTKEEYLKNLYHMIEFLTTEENYHVLRRINSSKNK
jgi:hypothetical protein